MKSSAGLPETLGALRNYKDLAAKLPHRTVKDELRENLICRLQKHEPLFPGIVGFDEVADGDHPRMFGGREQHLSTKIGMGIGLMRMNADRSPDVGLAFGDGDHRIPFGDPGRDIEHRRDKITPRTQCDGLFDIGKEF